MKRCCLLCLLIVGVGANERTWGQQRTWTDVRGRQMKAEFLRVENDKVFFRKDGRVFELYLDRLSTKDQIEVARLAAELAILGATTTQPAPSPAASPSVARQSKTTENPLKQVRTWTDIEGNTYTGVFVRITKQGAVIRKGSHQVTVPLHHLTPGDQQLLAKWLTTPVQSLPGVITSEPNAAPGGPLDAEPAPIDLAAPAPSVTTPSEVVRPLDLDPAALDAAMGSLRPQPQTLPQTLPQTPAVASSAPSPDSDDSDGGGIRSGTELASSKQFSAIEPLTPPTDVQPAPLGEASESSGFDYSDPYYMSNANKEDGFGHWVMGACLFGVIAIMALLRFDLLWRAWKS